MTTVALAHDVLGARAGGERVLVALTQAFPDAAIHTLFYEPTATFDVFTNCRVEPSRLNRFGWLRTHYRAAAPIGGVTFAATKIEADVTICSTSGLSHHARTTGAKVVYCHTPARWLHDTDVYMRGFGRSARSAVKMVRRGFVRFDRKAMRSADLVLANSAQVACEVDKIYNVAAPVVSPCSAFDLYAKASPIPGLKPGFVLSPTRPLGYKRLDVLLDAARRLPERHFVQIGAGPHLASLVDAAPSNLKCLGGVGDAKLRWAYQNAGVVALTCAEDFGLVPLEAAAHGVHTVAPNARGLLDHKRDMLTTYEFASVNGLVSAIAGAPEPTGRLIPGRLEVDRFITEIRAIVERVR